MTTPSQIRDLAATILGAAGTLAGSSVYTPRTYPTWKGSYPMIFLQPPDKRGENINGPNGAPLYEMNLKLLVSMRVDKPVTPLDAGAISALADLETMIEQVEAALINNTQFYNAGLQAFGTLHSKCSVETKERVLGEALISLEMIFRQGDFYAPDLPYLEAVDAVAQVPDGTYPVGAEIVLYPTDTNTA